MITRNNRIYGYALHLDLTLTLDVPRLGPSPFPIDWLQIHPNLSLLH